MSDSSLGKIAVVGAGAVGCYYGGLLAHAGRDVHFLMRSDLDAVRANGLTIMTRGETLRLPRVQAFAQRGDPGRDISGQLPVRHPWLSGFR